MMATKTTPTSLQYQKCLQTHKTFLQKFQSLPQKTRKSTYKQLLVLPNNYNHLQELTKNYPVLPQHGYNKQVAIVCDALRRRYPDLGNQWLPGMIYPFVRLFEEDYTFGFQCALGFLMNWLEPILYDFPNANKDIMDIFQECLPNLKHKIESLDYPLSSLINPMFVVSLTDVLNKKDWLQMCDFLVTNPFQPWHYISIAITIVSSIQSRLDKLQSPQQMSLMLRKQKNIPIQQILQKSVQISKKYKQKFQQIYKNAVFPLQPGRYPTHAFYRIPIRKTNSKLEIQDDVELERIKGKYRQLEGMLEGFIGGGHLRDQQAIQEKYQMVQGQVRQYLNQIKQEHANKMQALKQIESKFNAQLQSQGKNWQPKMTAIQKQARLQRQIQLVLAEAESIKHMEDAMMKRIHESLKIKKNQLHKINQALRKG